MLAAASRLKDLDGLEQCAFERRLTEGASCLPDRLTRCRPDAQAVVRCRGPIDHSDVQASAVLPRLRPRYQGRQSWQGPQALRHDGLTRRERAIGLSCHLANLAKIVSKACPRPSVHCMDLQTRTRRHVKSPTRTSPGLFVPESRSATSPSPAHRFQDALLHCPARRPLRQRRVRAVVWQCVRPLRFRADRPRRARLASLGRLGACRVRTVPG